MTIADLSNKRICILGFGQEGRAMAEAIEKHCKDFEITISDQNENVDVPKKYGRQLGTGWLENLEKFDLVLKSPGVSPHVLSTSQKYTTPTQIFFDTIQHSGATVVGVTGSKGKSTTASLLAHILGKKTHLIGNIGNPAISYVDKAKEGAVFVMEMSSYQLMDISVSPRIAVITSFFPEHLDYHRSLKKYLEAKKNITKFQTEDNLVFFNSASSECEEIAEEGDGKKIPVMVDNAPLQLSETKLIGEHNLMNIALAWKVAESLGVKKEHAIKLIKSFAPLPHRLQSLGVHHGFEWVNDSISTTPESTIAALDALGDRVAVMILGGQDRGLDFSELAERIKNSKVELVLTLGESGPRIAKALSESGATQSISEVQNLEEAMKLAKDHTSHISNPIVLLSPASPSYDQFKNFEERGTEFEKLAKN